MRYECTSYLHHTGTGQARADHQIAPLAGYSFAGVDPKYIGMGPMPAAQALLAKTYLAIDYS